MQGYFLLTALVNKELFKDIVLVFFKVWNLKR